MSKFNVPSHTRGHGSMGNRVFTLLRAGIRHFEFPVPVDVGKEKSYGQEGSAVGLVPRVQPGFPSNVSCWGLGMEA